MTNNTPSGIPLFISHTHEDSPLTKLIEKLIRDSCADVFNIFNTSNAPPQLGTEWREEILNHLSSAKIFLAILTPNSIQKYWVSFECGAAWRAAKMQEIKLIPCLYGLDEFPSHLSPHQGVYLWERDSVSQLINTLLIECGQNPRSYLLDKCINEYFQELETLKFEASTPQKTIEVETEKLITFITDYFPNDHAAIKFTSTLKRRGIIDANLYGAFLDNLPDKK